MADWKEGRRWNPLKLIQPVMTSVEVEDSFTKFAPLVVRELLWSWRAKSLVRKQFSQLYNLEQGIHKASPG